MELSNELGKTYITRLSHIYSILWKKRYDLQPLISYPALGKVFKELIVVLDEQQIAFLLIIFFDWAGASGNDEFIKRKLQNSTHSIFLFKNEIDSMRTYVQNVLKIDLSNKDEIEPHINKLINNNHA